MKVKSKSSLEANSFKPITVTIEVTLESRDEVGILKSLVAEAESCGIDVDGLSHKCDTMLNEIFESLSEVVEGL